jgi:hypothetical protein
MEAPNGEPDLPEHDRAEPGTPGVAAPPLQPEKPRAARWSDPVIAAASAALYILLQLLVVGLRLTAPVAVYAISIVSLAVTLAYAVALARSLRSLRTQLLWLEFTGAAMLPLIILPFMRYASPGQAARIVPILRVCLLVVAIVPGLHGVLLISLAVSIGVLLSRAFREFKLLLPAAVVLALVDLYVVFGGGLVTQANSGRAPAAQVAMRVMTVGLTPRLAGRGHAPPLAVGFADFLFIALFFAAFRRFGVPARRTFVLLCSILCLYLAAVVILHLDLPALVPIAIVVIGCNWTAFRYKRDEAFAMLYAGLIVLGILGALIYAAHR